jgi:chorismate mutase
MHQPIKSLDDLRREIDRIDDAIHDLVIQRTTLISEIATAKSLDRSNANGFLRPGREAMVMRRLLSRHRGPFPKPALVRLWRELIAGPLSLQGNFSVAVYAPPDAPGYWDLARDHYGSHTGFAAHGAASQVLAAVGGGRATVGILPTIAHDEPDPWWPALVREDGKGLAIIARLPIAGQGNARGDKIEALVVGHGVSEATGADCSFFVLETPQELSRARVAAWLEKAGLKPRQVTNWKPGSGDTLYLLELEDFVPEGDARIAEFRAQMGPEGGRCFHVGGYAAPFTPAELATA